MAFFGGGGASVDLASPSAIGSTTPNTGAFTTLSANNGTITTSSPAFTLAQTWNASAQTFTALRVDVTDTASGGNSLLMQLRVGGAQRLAVSKAGSIGSHGNIGLLGYLGFATANDPIGNMVVGFQRVSDSHIRVTNDQSTTSASLSALSFFVGATDVVLARDAAGTLAQRNSTNAQTFRLYNTYTDASNYERGFLRWTTNVLEIGAEAAGTGTQRQLRFPLGTVTASTPLSITQTWNSAGVTFTGLQLNVTDTTSASGSLLINLQVGGSSKFSVTKGGKVSASEDINSSTYVFATSEVYAGGTLGSSQFYAGSSGINLGSGTFLSWTNGNSLGTRDTFLYRDAANIVAQRNTTTSQTFRLYRTFTDASNYERLGFIATRTTRFAIAAENAGTGAARSLEISFYTSASDPTSTDITDGCFSVWKNSGTGTIKLWANDGGTMKSVALA